VRRPSFPSAVAWRSGMEPLKLDDGGAEGDEDTREEGVLHDIELERDSEAIAEESDGATQARPLTGPGIAAPSPRASAPPSGDRPEPELAGQWITTAQRARRGHTVQAQGVPEGFVYAMTLTYRKPGKRAPYGGYQATCYHHDRGETTGKRGNSSMLQCRKELPCGRKGDDCRVVNMLRDWICSANTFGDRLSHMVPAACTELRGAAEQA